MNIASKVHRGFLSGLLVLVAGEAAVLVASEFFGAGMLIIVFGTTIFLFVFLYSLYRTTQVLCPKCNNLYGVAIGLGGWPSIPSKCKFCGVDRVAL